MKKITALSCAATVLLTPNLFAGFMITPNWNTSQYGAGSLGGGEFSAVPNPEFAWILNNYDTKATYGGGFQTFCIEYNEHFNPGTTYNVAFNTGSVNGGVGGAVNGKDPLSKGTSWLYSQFAAGNLANYNYTFGAGRVASAADLQKAIWYLEDEIANLDPNNIFGQAIVTRFGSFNAAKADAALGEYNVKALNITDNGGGLHQDILVAVPEPGTYLAGLGALGMLGLFGWRNRK